MKRRDTLKFIPLSVAGLAFNSTLADAQPRPPMMGHPRRDRHPNDGALSTRYLKKVRNILTWIRNNQSDNLLESSYAIANALLKGNTCWYSWDCGHSVNSDIFPGRPAVPSLFTVGFDPKKARKGDVMLASIWNGVNAFIEGMGFGDGGEKPKILEPADVKAKGVMIIGAPAPWGMDAKGDEEVVYDSAKFRIRPSSSIWIETNATKLGAALELPGAGAPIGPVSGIVGMITAWMMTADACRILAREGKSLPVEGGGPKLSGDSVPWVSLDSPLMDDYFDTVMRQIGMIEAEMGDIRRIAGMAVDSVLSGGKVWCYSRDRNALAYESQTRRGGLALTRGLYDEDGQLSVFGKPFEGTSKDLVIMGIHEPDNTTDLKHLDTFRRHGCKVASIGPMTRDIKIPEGRTVPKETDVHLGRMCDTLGLFAVPGFERAICPTSGALLNQLFWTTCLEITDEIIRRTGNIPCVYLTGAVKGGIDHLNRVDRIYEERGY